MAESDYGDALLQSLVDWHRHDGMRLVPLVLSEVIDAVRAALRLRWESPMNRTVIIVTGVTVAAAAALAAGPLALIPIAVAVIAAGLWWSRQAQPIGRGSASHRVRVWLAMGVAGLGLAVLIPAIDGGELSEFWWTVFAVCLLGGIAMTVVGIIHAASNRGAGATTAR